MTISIQSSSQAAGRGLRRSLGLAAAASLLTLAACGAPTGPSGESPDYYTEAPPPPPPLMGGAPARDQDGLMGGPPAPVYSNDSLPAAAERADGVVRFRRADGVLVTTMRPIPNPEDLSAADRRRIYGQPPAPQRATAPQRVYGQITPAPRASQPAPVTRAPAAPAQVRAPAAPAPVAKAPAAPTMKPAPAPAAEQAGEEKSGGFFDFLKRFKFWGQDGAPEASAALEGAAEQAADAGEAVEAAATDAAGSAEQGAISGSTILMALAVLAAVLILAAISRNAAARRKEEQRRRRFRTFGYGGDTSEQDSDSGSSLAAPLAAAAAGAAAATAVAHSQDDSEAKSEEPAKENEPA